MTAHAEEGLPADATERSDWTVPRPSAVPRPTSAPVTMAFGLTLAFWGLVTSPVILGVGLVVVVVALAGWIGELRHEAG